MTATTSPITPAVLAWAIDEDGRSRAELADHLNVEPATLAAWASGAEQPRVGQVTDLAKALKRPRIFFFLPEPPSSRAMPTGFRHPPGSAGMSVPSSVLVQARRAQRIQRAIASATSEGDWPKVPTASPKDDPRVVAETARSWLGADDTTRWKDDRDALAYWRGLVDQAGVLVFELQLGTGEARGFAYWDSAAPLVVMNSSSVSPSARLFTLGHELAHLLLRDATACVEPKGGAITVDSATERWCERFAADLLIPGRAVSTLMRERNVTAGNAGIDDVKAVMSRFRVSARAAALRLNDLQFASPNLYGAVLAVFVPKAKQSGTPRNPPRYKARIRQYGTRAVSTVLSEFPQDDALSILRMNAEDTRLLANEVPGVAAV